MNEQRIHLDVNKTSRHTERVCIAQGDVGGTTIEAHVYDNGVAADLTGMSAQFVMHLPGVARYARDVNCDIDGNVVTYVVDEGHCAVVPGMTHVAYFELLDGPTVTYSTARFAVQVLKSAYDGATPAEEWDNAVTELIERGNNSVFSSATATVDNSTGTPSVDVTLGDPEPGGRNVDFAFHNLKGETGADGADGADGVSCTHTWNGTVLSVTSASGTSSADLKGPQGPQGPAGTVTLVQSGTQVTGPIAHATAKGWAEQDADPTPENPQEIRVARGRNLLDESAVTNGKYLASGGTETTDAAYSISDYVKVDGGTTYVTSGMGVVSSAYYAWYNSSKTYISATQQTADGFTLTAPANAAYLRVSLLNASLGSAQLELGSTPTPYVPYGHVGMEVDMIHLEQGSIDSQGESKDSDYRVRSNYIAVEYGKSYFMDAKSAKGAVDWWVHWYDADKVKVSGSSQWETVHAYAAPSNAAFIRVVVRYTVESTANPSDFDASFTFTTPIPLPSKGFAASLPDGTADTLTIDGAGKWEWESETAEVVLDGSSDEGWAGYGTGTSGKYRLNSVLIQSVARKTPTGTVAPIVCDMFAAKTLSNVYSCIQGISLDDVEAVISLYADSYQDVSSWRTYLASNNMTLLYPLATPTTESGYVDLPSIGGEAVVTIPELDELGVDYWVEQSVFEAARDWYERGDSIALTKFASLVSGAVAITQGGTGATTAGDARKNLGTPSSSSLATVEQSTATTNHAKDSHFIVDGELMKATAAIATGETITTSNATPATLQGQIDTLRDSVAIDGINSACFYHTSFWAMAMRFDVSATEYYSLGINDGQIALFHSVNGSISQIKSWS